MLSLEECRERKFISKKEFKIFKRMETASADAVRSLHEIEKTLQYPRPAISADDARLQLLALEALAVHLADIDRKFRFSRWMLADELNGRAPERGGRFP